MVAKAQWIQTSSGFGNNRSVGSLASSNGYVLAGILMPSGDPALDGVYRSSDNGLTWEAPDPESSFEPFDMYATGSTVYAASLSGYFVWVSYDSGATFEFNDQGNSTSVLNVVPCSGNILSNSSFGIFQSVEALPWEFTPNPFENTGIVDLASNGSILAATFNSTISQQGWVRVSTDCGNSWQDALVSNDGGFSSLSMSGSTLVTQNSLGAFISSDLGENWNTIGTINGAYVFSVIAEDGYIFATTDVGIYVSLDNGQSWIDITDGADPAAAGMSFRDITIHNGYVFMGTNNSSVWRRPFSDITSISTQHGGHIMMYPNPVRDELYLQFRNEDVFQGTFRIHSLTGHSVLSGHLSVTFGQAKIDMRSLPAGIYVLILESTIGDNIRKKFLVVD